MFASHEPKALDTARILARDLGLATPEAFAGLGEHRREEEPFLAEAEFQDRVRQFFEHPGELVFGTETASEALSRFGERVDLLALRAGNNIAIVAHGTVISLYVASRSGIDGYDLWRRLGLPSYVVMETPAPRLIEVVDSIP